jgi:hypothetical protein
MIRGRDEAPETSRANEPNRDADPRRQHQTVNVPEAGRRYTIAVETDPTPIAAPEPVTLEGSRLACIFLFPFEIHSDGYSEPIKLTTKEGVEAVIYFPFENADPSEFRQELRVDAVPVPGDEVHPLGEGMLHSDLRVSPNVRGASSLANALRIDVSRGSILRSALEVGALDYEAEDLARKFIAFVRDGTRQWWVGRGREHTEDRLRHTFLTDSRGVRVSPLVSRHVAFSLLGIEQPLNPDRFQSVCRFLEQGSPVWQSWQMFYDAVYYYASGDLSRAVLAAGGAVELERDRVAQRAKVRFRGTNLLKHIHIDAKKRFGRSFRDENRTEYGHVKELWLARGDVAHGKAPLMRRNGKIRPIVDQDLKPLLEAVLQLLNWLKQLTPPRS